MNTVIGKRKRSSGGSRSTSKRPSSGGKGTHASKKRNSRGSPSSARPSDLPRSLSVLDTKLGEFPTDGNKQSVDTFLSQLTDDLLNALITDVTALSGTNSNSSPSQSTPSAKRVKLPVTASTSVDSAILTQTLAAPNPLTDNSNAKSAPSAVEELTLTDDPQVEETVIESGHVNDQLSSEEHRPRRRTKRPPKRRHSPPEEVITGEPSVNGDVDSHLEEVQEKKRLKLTKPNGRESKTSKGSADLISKRASTPANSVGVTRGGSQLPWWRSTQNRVTVLDSPPNMAEIFCGYVKAIVKSCVNASWTTNDLRVAFDGDPCSEKGKAFRDLSTALVLMERARHMGHCRARWHQDIVSGLVSRHHARWSKVSLKRGDDFVGCDICKGVRPATERLIMSGENSDGREFWPTQMRIDVLSMRKLSDGGSYSLTVEVNREAISNGAVQTDAKNQDNDKVFFVDSQCLRQCLVFHRLVHATSIISSEVRGMIEDELREGVVELKVKSEVGDRSVLDALEEELMNCVLTRSDYLNRQVEGFLDMLKLGDLYLSADESEVIDSGCAEDELGRTKNTKPTIYDAPLYLGDERFVAQVNRLVAMSQMFGG